MAITIIVTMIIYLAISKIFWILKCNRLMKENMRLSTENMAIHELYLNRTCQCKETGKLPDILPDCGPFWADLPDASAIGE